MTIDHDGRFAKKRLPSSSTSEVRQAGANPTLILSSDFPLTVGNDGALYYPELAPDDRLKILRLEPSGAHTVMATLPASTEGSALRWVNGMAAGPDGSIYYTENKAVRKVSQQGTVSTLAGNVSVPDCSPIPGADAHLGAFLRGLAAGPDGTLYVAASGCSALLKITARGEITPVLRASSPWSPTGVAVAQDSVYVLEYIHTASDNRKEWAPRVRKISPDGEVTTIATVERR
jgi:hypothetical protein